MDNKRSCFTKHDQLVGAGPLATPVAGSSKPTIDETVERNPLLMEDVRKAITNLIILDNLFKYMNDSQDILNARLVCKAWRLSATKLLELPLEFPVELLEQANRADVIRFRRFLDTMENSELVPVKNYAISSEVLITTEEEDEGDLLGDFFRICGPDVVSLKLDLESKVGKKLEIPKEVNVGKLRKLSLGIALEDDDEDGQRSHLHDFHLLAELILDSATMLQKLKYCYDDRLFKSLTDKGLQLTKLVLSNNVKPKSMEESETIRKFLQTQTNTLLRLELSGGYHAGDICSLNFPMLLKLVHLKLEGVEIAPFVVSEIFPKLRCLDVINWAPTGRATLPDILILKKPSTTLKELWLPWGFPSEQIKNFSFGFPLITELHVGGSSIANLLEQVFIHLPLLKHLGLDSDEGRGSFFIDSILCGIPMDVCKRIIRLPLIEFQNLELSELQKKPSLANLPLLQKLEIWNFGRDGPSDISARFLFLELPNLKELECYPCLFSAAYMEMLRERIPKIKFTEMDQLVYSDSEEEDSDEQGEDTDASETDMENN